MREDFMEELDRMFPEGYVILYTCPNSTFRMSLYNPNKYEIIEKYQSLIRQEAE